MSSINLAKRKDILQGLKQQIRKRSSNKNQIQKGNVLNDKKVVKDLNQVFSLPKKSKNCTNQLNTMSTKRRSQTARVQRQKGTITKNNFMKEATQEQQNATNNIINQIISLVKYTLTSANKALALSNVQSHFEAKVAYKLYCSDRDMLIRYIQKITKRSFNCSSQKFDLYLKKKQEELYLKAQRDNVQEEQQNARPRDSKRYTASVLHRANCFEEKQQQNAQDYMNSRFAQLLRNIQNSSEIEQYIKQVSCQSLLKKVLKSYSSIQIRQESFFEQKESILQAKARTQNSLQTVQKKLQSMERDITYKIKMSLQSNQNYEESSIEMQKLRIFINQKIVPQLRSCGFAQKLTELQEFNVFQIIKLYLQCVEDIKTELIKELQKTKKMNQASQRSDEKHYGSSQKVLIKEIARLKEQIQTSRNNQRKLSQQFSSMPNSQKKSLVSRVPDIQQFSGFKQDSLNIKKNSEGSLINLSIIYENAQKDNRNLRTRLSKSQRDYKRLQEQIQKLQIEIDKVKIENQQNQTRHSEEISRLEKQNQCLYQNIKKLKKQARKDSKTIKHQEVLNEQVTEISELNQEINSNQLKRLNQIISSKNQKIIQLSKRIESKQNQLESLIMKNAGKIAQVQKQHRDHDFQISSCLTEKQNTIIQLKRQLLSREFMLNQYIRKENQVKNEFKDTLQQHRELFQKQKSQLIAMKQQEFYKSKVILQGKINQLRLQIINQKNQYQKLTQEKQSQLTAKIQDKQREYKQYQRKVENEKWQIKREFIQKINQAVESQKKLFQKQREKFFQELSTAKNSLLQSQQKIMHAKWQQETLVKTYQYSIKQYKQKLQQKSRQIQSINQNYLERIQLVESKYEEQSTQLQAYKRNIKEIVSINKKLSEQKKQLHQIAQSLQKKINEHSSSLNSRNGEREQLQNNYRQRIQALLEDLNSKKAGFESVSKQMKIKQVQCQKLKNDAIQLKAQIQQAQLRVIQLKEQYSKLLSGFNEAQKSRCEIQSKYDQIEKQNRSLIQKASQLSEFKVKMDQLQVEVEQWKRINQLQMEKSNRVEVQNKALIQKLTQLSECKSKMINLQVEVEDLKKTNQIYMEKSIKFEEENKTLMQIVSQSNKCKIRNNQQQVEFQDLKRTNRLQMQNQLPTQQSQLLQTYNNLLQESQNLRQTIISKESEDKKLQDKIKQLNDVIRQLQQKQSNAIQQKSVEIKQLRQDKRKVQEKFQEQVASLKDRIEELDQVSTTLREQKANLLEDIKIVEQSASKTSQLFQYIKKIQLEKSELCQQLNSKKNSLDKLSKELDIQLRAKAEIEESLRTNQNTKSQIQSYNDKYAAMQTVYIGRVKQLQTNLKENSELIRKLNEEKLKAQLQFKKKQLLSQNKIEQLERAIHQSSKVNQLMVDKIAIKDIQILELKESLQMLITQSKLSKVNQYNSMPTNAPRLQKEISLLQKSSQFQFANSFQFHYVENDKKILQLQSIISKLKQERDIIIKHGEIEVEIWKEKYSEEMHSSKLKDSVIKQYQKEIDEGPHSQSRSKILQSLKIKKQKIADLLEKINDRKESEKIKTERIVQLSEQLQNSQQKIEQLTKKIDELKLTFQNQLKKKQETILILNEDLSTAKQTLAMKIKSVDFVQIPFSESYCSEDHADEKDRNLFIQSEKSQKTPFGPKKLVNKRQKLIQMSKQELLEHLNKTVQNGDIQNSIKPQMLQSLIEQANSNSKLKQQLKTKTDQIQYLKKLLFDDQAGNTSNKDQNPLIPCTHDMDDFLNSGKKNSSVGYRSSGNRSIGNRSIGNGSIGNRPNLPSMQELTNQQTIANLKEQMQSNQELYESVLQQRNEEIKILKEQILKKKQFIQYLQHQVADFDRSETEGETGIQLNTLQEIKKFKQMLYQIMNETQKKLTVMQKQKNQLSEVISTACNKASAIYLLLGCQGYTQNSKNGLIKMLQTIHQKYKDQSQQVNKSLQFENNSEFNKNQNKSKSKQKLKQPKQNKEKPKQIQQAQKSLQQQVITQISISELRIPEKTPIQQNIQQSMFYKQPEQQIDIGKTGQGKKVTKSDRKYQEQQNDYSTRMIRSERNFDWCTTSLKKSVKRQPDPHFIKKMENFLVSNKEARENQNKKVLQKYEIKKRMETLSKKARTGELSMMQSLEFGQILQSVADEQDHLNKEQIFSPLKRKNSIQSAKQINIQIKSPELAYTPNRLGNISNNQQFGPPSYHSPVSSSSKSIDRTPSSHSSKQRIHSHRDMQQVSEVISQQMSGMQDSDQQIKSDFSPQTLKELSCKQSFRQKKDKNSSQSHELPEKLEFDGEVQFKIAVNAPNSSQMHLNPIKTESFFLSLKPVKTYASNELSLPKSEEVRLNLSKNR